MSGADLYESIGGLEGCRKLSVAFYARVARDPLLIPIFPGSFHCAIEALARFLAQFLDGPPVYSPQRWHLSLREAHWRFRIGQKERNAWIRNMRDAIAEAGIGGAARTALIEFFEQASTYLINRPASPEGVPLRGPLARNWDRYLSLEQAVAAARAGSVVDGPRLAECFERDPAARVSLFAIMIGSGMDDHVSECLRREPDLARGRHVYGRTLLHDAAAAGNLRIARLLLELEADPNAGPHTPLYLVGNSCSAPTGGEMVKLLVSAGALVNTQEGVKRCT
ncbi:MAG TPA: hypothetical protein VGS58_04570, partial [Candidatus Sulfopaludibacter sp.]|nr:hypothetical protein [Candidatus Sulfopaludibacter sp.]